MLPGRRAILRPGSWTNPPSAVSARDGPTIGNRGDEGSEPRPSANRKVLRRVYRTTGGPKSMRMSPAQEADLIARAQSGDVEAFCQLAANHQRNLYVLALKYSGNHHDAEDLTQEVMINAYRAIRQFKGMSSFHTWLSRIMVNCFLNK